MHGDKKTNANTTAQWEVSVNLVESDRKTVPFQRYVGAQSRGKRGRTERERTLKCWLKFPPLLSSSVATRGDSKAAQSSYLSGNAAEESETSCVVSASSWELSCVLLCSATPPSSFGSCPNEEWSCQIWAPPVLNNSKANVFQILILDLHACGGS